MAAQELPKRMLGEQIDKEAFNKTIGTEFQTAAGEVEKLELTGKIIGLCFAYCPWDGPFFDFPAMFETYKNVNAAGKKFEVIFVFDPHGMKEWSEVVGEEGIEAEFNSTCAEMPWLAIPKGDPRHKELVAMFKEARVIGPRSRELIMLDEERNVITVMGAKAMRVDNEGKGFPWHMEWVADFDLGWTPYEDIFQYKGYSVIVLCEAADEKTKAAIQQALTLSAVEASQYQFLTGKCYSRATVEVRALCGLPAFRDTDKPLMMLLDLKCAGFRDEGVFYVAEGGEITAARVQAFVQMHKEHNAPGAANHSFKGFKGTECDFPAYLSMFNKIRNGPWPPPASEPRLPATQGPEQTRATQGPEQTRATQGPGQTRATQGPGQTRATQGPVQTRATQGPVQTRGKMLLGLVGLAAVAFVVIGRIRKR